MFDVLVGVCYEWDVFRSGEIRVFVVSLIYVLANVDWGFCEWCFSGWGILCLCYFIWGVFRSCVRGSESEWSCGCCGWICRLGEIFRRYGGYFVMEVSLECEWIEMIRCSGIKYLFVCFKFSGGSDWRWVGEGMWCYWCCCGVFLVGELVRRRSVVRRYGINGWCDVMGCCDFCC